MLRIGVDVTWIEDRPSGVGQMALEVLEELRGREDVEVVEFSYVDRGFLRHFLIWRDIKRAKLDLFWQLGGWLPLFGGFLRGKTVFVQTVHDLIIFRHPEWFAQSGFSLWWSLNARVLWAVRQADFLHCISEWTRGEVLGVFGEAAYEKSFVALQGVGEVCCEDEVTVALEDVGGCRLVDGRFVLVLGTLEPRKNVVGAVGGFLEFVDRGGGCFDGVPDLVLVVAGKVGWRAEESLNVIRDGGERVVFLDYVSDDEKWRLLRRAEVLLMPSFEEGFGRGLVEAMMVGTPVVAGGGSGMEEALGGAGVIVGDVGNVGSIADGLARAFCERDVLVADIKKRALELRVCDMVDSVLEKSLGYYYED